MSLESKLHDAAAIVESFRNKEIRPNDYTVDNISKLVSEYTGTPRIKDEELD